MGHPVRSADKCSSSEERKTWQTNWLSAHSITRACELRRSLSFIIDHLDKELNMTALVPDQELGEQSYIFFKDLRQGLCVNRLV